MIDDTISRPGGIGTVSSQSATDQLVEHEADPAVQDILPVTDTSSQYQTAADPMELNVEPLQNVLSTEDLSWLEAIEHNSLKEEIDMVLPEHSDQQENMCSRELDEKILSKFTELSPGDLEIFELPPSQREELKTPIQKII
ncbi:uncharacterized protein LOC123498743 [Portunus trituberculatus]|uniref:uncharacterized protein LOC123498743 n=1 Tax=Portunus trituberculatus TaxID=210409 RepID=UPI001E1CC26B|nr:uncharacterized protein LOC123498743 [Portunus trituberculatus]XP_045102081.1 uncharacterized protein LOC123498743 [Portunus trituberculatus]